MFSFNLTCCPLETSFGVENENHLKFSIDCILNSDDVCRWCCIAENQKIPNVWIIFHRAADYWATETVVVARQWFASTVVNWNLIGHVEITFGYQRLQWWNCFTYKWGSKLFNIPFSYFVLYFVCRSGIFRFSAHTTTKMK